MFVTRRITIGLQGLLLTVAVIAALVLVGCAKSTPPKTGEAAAEEKVPEGSTVLKGAGATFPFPLYKRWFSAYRGLHSDTYVKYAAVGSGEGIRRFVGKDVSADESVDFGASDAAMTDAQIADTNNNTLMVPATAGCVVLAYNIPGFTGELKLSREAYSGIFLGEITNWNDPRIAKTNPGVKLPNLTIATVVRQDGSGTTFAFTNNLGAINARWRGQFGAVTLANWPGNAMRAKGNEHVAATIENSAGAIGYVGYEFARRLGLTMASLENKDGKFVQPSGSSCGAALATADMPDNLRVFIPDPSGSDAYPIVTYSWVLLHKQYKDTQTASALKQLFQWALKDGQGYSAELGYVPVPATVADKAIAAMNTISGGN